MFTSQLQMSQHEPQSIEMSQRYTVPVEGVADCHDEEDRKPHPDEDKDLLRENVDYEYALEIV